VRDRDRAREVGEEDEARLQQRDEEEVAVRVILRDLCAELTNACAELVGAEEDVADVLIFYEARSNRYRWASRSMSRL
jgi:hypothetical protein